MKDAAFALRVEGGSYALQLEGHVVATLPGGPAALLAGMPARATEAHVEGAIERAEDWAWDDVAFGRPLDPALLADLVLLRELVHHGAAPRVALD